MQEKAIKNKNKVKCSDHVFHSVPRSLDDRQTLATNKDENTIYKISKTTDPD